VIPFSVVIISVDFYTRQCVPSWIRATVGTKEIGAHAGGGMQLYK
jgi:hypothetical protein